MARELYTLYTHEYPDGATSLDEGKRVELRVYTDGHRQHIWNETTLVGVARSAQAKIQDFVAKFGEPVYVEVGDYGPIKLVGVEYRA